LLDSAHISLTSNTTAVETALSEGNLEETIVTPLLSPGVSGDPVVDTVFLAPTDNLDGMTTKTFAGNVLIDTRLVCLEVFVDDEGSLNGSVLEETHLDGLRVRKSNSAALLGVVVNLSRAISAGLELVALDGVRTVARLIRQALFSDGTDSFKELP